MSETSRNWLRKAEDDYRMACALMGQAEPMYDGVCYHSQQCIEKLIKGLLIQHEQDMLKIHDLVKLARQLEPILKKWKPDINALKALSDSGVMFRYPDEFATKEEASYVLSLCRDIRTELLPYFEK